MQTDPFFVDALTQINERLDALIPEQGPLQISAKYSLSPPAKRLRPLLVLAVVASYGIPLDTALEPACAIEMVHTYSLIHDDLPCMDNDDLRRGKPTLHKVVPEWQALLTGDYLLTYAFEVLAAAPHLTDGQKLALIRILSHRAGAEGMIGGQMIDLLSVEKTIDWETLEKMHLGKTAALITAALECGGIIAGAPEKDIHTLQQIGFAIGVAFQLIDDVLDYTSTEEELGKPIGSDLHKAKATAVSLLGITQAKEKAAALLDSVNDGLGTLSCKTPLLKRLFHEMVHRSK